MVVSIDLIAAIIQALGPHAQSLITSGTEQHNLFQIMLYGMRDETFELRSCAFALLGDLALHHTNLTLPILDSIVASMLNTLDPENSRARQNATSAMNNAAWSCGEVVLRLSNEQFAPFAPALIEKLIILLVNGGTTKSLQENCSIALGRIGYCCPQIVSHYLPSFIQPWCQSISHIQDNAEKASAYTGICRAVTQNPNAIMGSILYFLSAICQFDVSHQPELMQLFRQVFPFNKVLLLFRNAIGEQWAQTVSQLTQPTREKLEQVYRI